MSLETLEYKTGSLKWLLKVYLKDREIVCVLESATEVVLFVEG